MSAFAHIPVLLSEVAAAAAPGDHEIFIDATFGGGGYAKALLDKADCTVIGIDRDDYAIKNAQTLIQKYAPRLSVKHGCFADMDKLVDTPVDGIVFDLGVSSPQIDDAARGFSFLKDGPLDMRMGSTGASAADLVQTLSEQELSRIIFNYGEERLARKIAKTIVSTRHTAPITTTKALADLVAGVVPKSKDGLHPATRTFQALRIAVNDELHQIEDGLRAAEKLLKPGGRLVVVSFHSLEDRIVKTFLKDKSTSKPNVSRHMPAAAPKHGEFTFKLLNKKPVTASEQEIRINPRARSAKLRAAVKLGGL